MGRGNNEPDTRRDFFFTPAGGNTLSGRSDETPVADPQTAILRVNALDPPPSSSNPASINSSVTGQFNTGVVLPDFTKCNCRDASIITFTSSVVVDCGNRQSVTWNALLSFIDFGICVRVASKERLRAIINVVVVGSDVQGVKDGIGFEVSGVCDDVFIELVEGELRGERARLIHHTSSCPTPVEYTIGIVKFFNIDQTLMEFDPPSINDQAIINITSAQESATAIKSTTGSMLFRAMAGRLIVDAEVLQAETLVIVEPGARFALTALVAFGNIIIRTDAVADITVGLLVGNITVEGTGILNIVALTHVGTITPPERNSGNIHGTLGGDRYSSWLVTVENLLTAFSTGNQNPAGLDTPLKIEYGVAQNGASDPVEIDALGNITINETGQYRFKVTLQYGRTGAGMASWLFFWLEVNGIPRGTSILGKLDNANADIPVQFLGDADLIAGDVVTSFLVRDSQGFDSGGLFTETPTLGTIPISPSARLSVERYL